jgi:hypothetical protein
VPRSRGELLLQRGTFYIAALAVTETLARTQRPELTALCPWQATEPPLALRAVYDSIATALAERPPWYSATLRMIGRLRAVIGNLNGTEAPHALEWPAQLIDEVEHGVLSFTAFEHGEPELDAVLALARMRGVTPERLAEAVWSAWDNAGKPGVARILAPTSSWAAFLYQNASPLRLEQRLGLVPMPELDFTWLSAEGFRGISRLAPVLTQRAALEAMPAELFESLARSPATRALLAPGFDVVWSRAEDAARSALREELLLGASARADVLRAMLVSAPPALVPHVLSELGREERTFALSPAALEIVRRSLQHWASERASGWRDAYSALFRLERERRTSL